MPPTRLAPLLQGLRNTTVCEMPTDAVDATRSPVAAAQAASGHTAFIQAHRVCRRRSLRSCYRKYARPRCSRCTADAVDRTRSPVAAVQAASGHTAFIQAHRVHPGTPRTPPTQLAPLLQEIRKATVFQIHRRRCGWNADPCSSGASLVQAHRVHPGTSRIPPTQLAQLLQEIRKASVFQMHHRRC